MVVLGNIYMNAAIYNDTSYYYRKMLTYKNRSEILFNFASANSKIPCKFSENKLFIKLICHYEFL